MAHEQPHDRLIKETLSFQPEAVLFFQFTLPAYISGKLDFSTLRLESTSYVNEQAREFYSDLVFSCNWKSGGLAKLQFLVEHKSGPEKRPLIQIGAYLSEGYVYQGKQQSEEKKNEPLFIIIPVLLYHGTENWQAKEYESYFNLPDPALKEYLPAFKVIRVNMNEISDEDIIALGAFFLVTTLLLFKHKKVKNMC